MDLSFVQDEALRAKIKEAIEAAVNDATIGLKSKNDELLIKLKKAKQGGEVDPAEHQRIIEENDKLSSDNAELKKTVKRFETENATYKKNYESESAFSSKLLIDNGLTESLIKAGVKPEFTSAVKALLSPLAKIKIDGENRIAMLGDKTLIEGVDAWSKTDEGKHFIVAKGNQGSGANGGSDGKGKKTIKRDAFDAMTATDKMTAIKEGASIID